MSEDIELMNRIRCGLEDGVPSASPRLHAIAREAAVLAARRRRWRIVGRATATLLAASLAVACVWPVLPLNRRPTPENTVAYVIDLLRASDGIDDELASLSVAERLLAWQDAPYESALSDLVSEN